MALHGESVEVAINMESIMRQYSHIADEIVRAVAAEMLKETRRHARMAFTNRSGKLWKSIKRKKSKIHPNQVIVGAFAPHAVLIEYGHAMVDHAGHTAGHVAARPFLRPAKAAVEARLTDIVNRILSES